MVVEEEGGLVSGEGRPAFDAASGQLEHDRRPSWNLGELAEVQLSQSCHSWAMQDCELGAELGATTFETSGKRVGDMCPPTLCPPTQR